MATSLEWGLEQRAVGHRRRRADEVQVQTAITPAVLALWWQVALKLTLH